MLDHLGNMLPDEDNSADGSATGCAIDAFSASFLVHFLFRPLVRRLEWKLANECAVAFSLKFLKGVELKADC